MAYTNKTNIGSDAVIVSLKADIIAAGWTQSWTLTVTDPDIEEFGFSNPINDTHVTFKYSKKYPGSENATLSVSSCVAISATASAYNGHVNSSQHNTHIPLDKLLETEYFLNVNSRRIVLATRISTVYESLYAGKFLPYAFPNDYNFPLYVAGSMGSPPGDNAYLYLHDWRDISVSHVSATSPSQYLPTHGRAATFLNPAGTWEEVSVHGYSNIKLSPQGSPTSFDQGLKPNLGWDKVTTCYGGGYILHPIKIYKSPTGGMTEGASYGVLDGLYRTPGIGQVAENVLVQNNVSHLVVQDAFRTTPSAFSAIVME